MKKKVTAHKLLFFAIFLIYLGGMILFKAAQFLWVSIPVDDLNINHLVAGIAVLAGILCVKKGIYLTKRAFNPQHYFEVKSDNDSVTFIYHAPDHEPIKHTIPFSQIGLIDVDRYGDSIHKLLDRSGKDIMIPIRTEYCIEYIELIEEAMSKAKLKSSWFLYRKQKWVIWVSEFCPELLSKMPDSGSSAIRVGGGSPISENSLD